METLIKMINIFAWIAVIGCPIMVIVKIYMQSQYENSLEKMVDRLKGYDATYMKGVGKLLLVFVIALVYLIAK